MKNTRIVFFLMTEELDAFSNLLAKKLTYRKQAEETENSLSYFHYSSAFL
ncbi:hypothetical protein [Enterococcus hirae]|nr:hypothetical protein [Enterococcus hirae]